jgi:hypothetical protein
VPVGLTAAQAAAVGLAAVTARDLIAALSLTGEDIVLVFGATGATGATVATGATGVGAVAVQLAAAAGATVLATARPGPASAVTTNLRRAQRTCGLGRSWWSTPSTFVVTALAAPAPGRPWTTPPTSPPRHGPRPPTA